MRADNLHCLKDNEESVMRLSEAADIVQALADEYPELEVPEGFVNWAFAKVRELQNERSQPVQYTFEQVIVALKAAENVSALEPQGKLMLDQLANKDADVRYRALSIDWHSFVCLSVVLRNNLPGITTEDLKAIRNQMLNKLEDSRVQRVERRRSERVRRGRVQVINYDWGPDTRLGLLVRRMRTIGYREKKQLKEKGVSREQLFYCWIHGKNGKDLPTVYKYRDPETGRMRVSRDES